MVVRVRREESGKSVVELDGSFNLETTPRVRRTLIRLAKKHRSEELELDFSSVSAIDTSGVAVLIELMRFLSQKGSQLRLKGLNEDVRGVIRLMGLDGILGRAIVGAAGNEG